VLQVGGLTVYATRKVTSSSGQNERTTYQPIVCSPVRSQAKHSQSRIREQTNESQQND
jgi:hypothetical protein